jgi:hypothetical protein
MTTRPVRFLGALALLWCGFALCACDDEEPPSFASTVCAYIQVNGGEVVAPESGGCGLPEAGDDSR